MLVGAALDYRRIWGVRAGNSSQVDHIFLDTGHLAISSPHIQDVSLVAPSRTAMKEAFSQSDSAVQQGTIPSQAGQLYRFVHEMRIGDRVIYPRKVDRTLRWGEVIGPYVYDGEGAPDYAHRRGVRWLARKSRDEFSQGALYELGSVATLFEIRSFADEFREKFEGLAAKPADLLLHDMMEDNDQNILHDIAETTKDFISKKLKTDLKGYRMEPFVADLFRAMGYRAQATRKIKDDGIDVIAHRDELGIEPPILKIQVKAQDGNIGADVVKAFYAMIHDRDVGIFITTGGFTAASLDFARTKGNLKLINGVEFVDLIQKYYDMLDLKFRQQIPLRRVLVPDITLDIE